MRRIASRAQLGASLIRQASTNEAALMRRLDDASFPLENPDAQRAAPDELETAVANGDVWVLVLDKDPVAYIHIDRRRADRIYVSGLAVRPDVQGHGIGSMMMDHFLHSIPGTMRAQIPVVTVTSPRNLVMLRLLLSRGFAARWLLRDHFGPGKDRFGCQLLAYDRRPPLATDLYWVPGTALPGMYWLIDVHRYIVLALTSRLGESSFGLARSWPGAFLPSDPP